MKNISKLLIQGDMLASGGDDGTVLIWRKSNRETDKNDFNRDEDDNKENYTVFKTFRGGSEFYDLSWSPCQTSIVATSVDNSSKIYSLNTNSNLPLLLHDHTHYVQGVTWDPKGINNIKFYNNMMLKKDSNTQPHNAKNFVKISEKKRVQKKIEIKQVLSGQKQVQVKSQKLYLDEEFQSYFRRLSFSPDGSVLLTPSGLHGADTNVCYGFCRGKVSSEPAFFIDTKSPSVAVRFNPIPLKSNPSDSKFLELEGYKLIFAIATTDSILIYSSESRIPICYFGGLHYSNYTDLTWSADGLSLMAASQDGYCSLITFEVDELGIKFSDEEEKPAFFEKKLKDIQIETSKPDADTLETVKEDKFQMNYTKSIHNINNLIKKKKKNEVEIQEDLEREIMDKNLNNAIILDKEVELTTKEVEVNWIKKRKISPNCVEPSETFH
ncbi:Chromatin assembly factor 1 subunit B [Lobulomyces angularis]|nr:Chromatin assembly factor 1 subunit B [Lobulomyces angularis]